MRESSREKDFGIGHKKTQSVFRNDWVYIFALQNNISMLFQGKDTDFKAVFSAFFNN
jgi:hypothetical protein